MDEKTIQEAVRILRGYGDPACHEEMIQTLLRGYAAGADVQPGGVMVHNARAGIYMLAGYSLDRFEQMLSRIPQGATDIILHGTLAEDTVQRVRERFGLKNVQRFYEYAYYGELPELPPEFDVRPLGMDDFDFVFENYGHASREYLKERFEDGVMLGAYAGGELAAFIGEHVEGAMGLLHVMPAHRREHLGFLLERAAIRRTMLLGQVPFCQVFENNAASRSLQSRLGMTRSQGHVYWLTNDAF